MRRIDLEPPSTRVWKLWRRDCERETAALLVAAQRNERLTFLDLYRRLSIRKTFYFSGGPPFFGKCVYCERPISLKDGDLDHFRPKGGVTWADDTPVVELDDQGSPIVHLGYYWLAYDWRNLLPACKQCNQASAVGELRVGKRARFPVEGRHARRPEELEDEKPLLIHPASGRPEDDPDLHLRADTASGLLFPLTERGKTCIEVFGLNHFETLVDERRKASREVFELLNRQMRREAEAQKDLLDIRAGKRPYSCVQRAVLREVGELLRPVLMA